MRGQKKLGKIGRQCESWRFNTANILQPYEKIWLRPTKTEMEGRVELAHEQDFSPIMATAVACYTTLYEFLNMPQTSKGCSKYLSRQTFLK